MAMSLEANGVQTNEDEVNKVMGARPMRGAAWEDALACAQHYGMRATLCVPATVLQLRAYTDRGVPVMIAWNPEGRDWSHASVVFDVDDDLNVYVADPNIPNPDENVRVVPKDEFYGKWFEKHQNGYLIRRPAMAVEREITTDGRQVVASTKTADEISKIHPQMAKALSSTISGAGSPTPDYWSTGVFLPRDLGHGMYLQTNSQESPKTGGYSASISVWTPMGARGGNWRSIYYKIVDVLKKARSAMGRLGNATTNDNRNNYNLWVEFPADKLGEAQRMLPTIAKNIGREVDKILKDHRGEHAQESVMASYPDIHPRARELAQGWEGVEVHPHVATLDREAAPRLTKDQIERALKGSKLKYKFTPTDGGSFLIEGLGPMMSDYEDIGLDHRGGAPKDATRWKATFEGRTHYLASASDLSKYIKLLSAKHQSFQESMGRRAQQESTPMSESTIEKQWGELHPGTREILAQEAEQTDRAAFEAEVERHVQAKKSEDDDEDKDAKFERGEDVPLSEMPKKLQENAKDPPPSVQKVKKKIQEKNKSAAQFPFVHVHLDDADLPNLGTTVTAHEVPWVVSRTASTNNVGEVWLIREDHFDKMAAGEADKTAARAPSGLYGFTKQIQADCEIAARRLRKAALSIASQAVAKDAKVANFWATHAKRSRSQTAKMLLAALEANRKVAVEAGEKILMGKEAADKEAAFGYYGFRARTARRALTAQAALREEAGIIAAGLHARRAAMHEKITGFLSMHSKKSRCAASRMLVEAYPEAGMKLASGPEPQGVEDWLTWEPDEG